MSFPAFLDTCTIFGAAVNDLFLELAEEGSYRPLWSSDVLGELERHLADRIGADKATDRVSAMRDAFPDAMVDGYESLIPSMTNDPKDRHVLAAAVRANAEVIVTFNLSDFPEEALDPYDVCAIHPDEFLLDQLDLYPELTVKAVENIAEGYESPPMTTLDFLEKLERGGVPKFVVAVRLVLS